MATRTSNPHIQRLEHNKGGRDFVLGDLHGCMGPLKTLMQQVEFNPNKDRMISVGDLPNRGPDSLECLGLLSQPWFHAVRGNHDQNATDALQHHFGIPSPNADSFYTLAVNGGLWLCELVAKAASGSPKAPLINQALAESLHQLTKTPKILLVGNDKYQYNVVHSFLLKNDDLMPHEEGFEKNIFLSQELDLIAQGRLPIPKPHLLNESKLVGAFLKEGEKRILEGKKPKQEPTQATLEKISKEPPTFCGHTPLNHPRAFLGHFHLDTGAGKENTDKVVRKLSMINATTGELYQTPAHFPALKITPKDYAQEVSQSLKKGKPIPSPHEVAPTGP